MVEAKISGYVSHGGRHTFCSWLAMAGATIKEIQELAGNMTITMTANYAYLSPDHKLSVLYRIARTATGKDNRTKTATSQKRPLRRSGQKKLDLLILLVPGGGSNPYDLAIGGF